MAVAALGLFLLASAGGAFLGVFEKGAPAPVEAPRLARRPSVLLISVDTLRADYLGVYGGNEARTEAIDRLASEGVVFERAVSHVALTLPSHASLFTSRTPPGHGVRDNATYRLHPEQTTLAEVLQSAGYRTAGFIGAFVLDGRFGLSQGFDVYDDDLAGYDEPERRADAVLAAASRWLEGVEPREPWFAFVHLFDPHAPYEPVPPFGGGPGRSPYAGEVAFVDHALGRFFDELRARGQLDETLVVLTSDHGEGLGEHGERTHGMFAYDSTLHVPLLMRWPDGLPAGRRIVERVRLMDVAPTILELARLEIPDTFEGRSTLPIVRGSDAEGDRTSYFEALTYSFNRGTAPLFGLYQGDYKLVSLPIPELYDVKSDPKELRNLAASREARMREMTNTLRELARSDDDSSRVPSEEVDTDTLERVHALGYIVAPRRLTTLAREYGPDDDPKRWIHLANQLDEAVNHHRGGRLQEASHLLREILDERPTVATAYARLARVLDDQGRPAEALALLEQAFARGIHAPEVVSLLGRHLAAEGRQARWAEVLASVVAQSPDDADALEALASALSRLGRHEEAAVHLERVVALGHGDFATELELGLAYLRAGRLADAESRLRRAVERNPSNAPAWAALGALHAARGRTPDAIAAWRRAADAEATPPETLVQLGLALADAGQPGEAIAYLEVFLETAPGEIYTDELRQVRELVSALERESTPSR